MASFRKGIDRKPSFYRIPEPVAKSIPVLSNIIGSNIDLNEHVLREHIDKVTDVVWTKELDTIKSEGNLESWKDFILMACLACVEADQENHLKATLRHWPPGIPNPNHELILRACKKNSFECIRVLYQAGFAVQSTFEENYYDPRASQSFLIEITEKGYDTFYELQVLEASSKPGYLLARASNLPDGIPCHLDPIASSFRLLSICQELGRTLKAHCNKIKRIKRDLKDFQVEMLNLCEGIDEVEELLNRNDHIDGISIANQDMLPRLYEAIRLKNKKFVVHDGCQQKIRELFYDPRYGSDRHKTLSYRIWYIISQGLLTPVFSIAHIYSHMFNNRFSQKTSNEWKLNEKNVVLNITEKKVESSCVMKLCQNLETPFNRMISHSSSYMIFVGLLIFVLANPLDDDKQLAWYDILAFIWALGYLVLETQLMYQLYSTVRKQSLVKKVKCLFSSPSINFQFFSHFLLLFGMIIKSAGYKFDSHNAINVGVSSLGFGTTLCMVSVLLYFRLSSKIGPIHAAMLRCIEILLTFFITFMVFTISFAVGLNYVSRSTAGVSNITHTSVYLADNHSIFSSWSVACYQNDVVANCTPSCFEKLIKTTFKEPQRENNGTSDPCSGFTVNWTRIEPESLKNLDETEDHQNQFLTFRKAIKTLFWSLFDPGKAEVIGRIEGVQRYSAMIMWYIYNIITVTILLNLLVAIMNAAVTSVQANSIDAWKFQRTQVWVDYCNRHVILPPPFNLLYFISSLWLVMRKPCVIRPKTDAGKSSHSTPAEIRYSELIQDLMVKYRTVKHNNAKDRETERANNLQRENVK